MHLIIYGPEGSGKGTQAKLLSQRLNLPVITAGDLVREEAADDKSEIGNICRSSLIEGKYVSDEIMFTLWQKKFSSKPKSGFILDGFPRNMNQAKFLFENAAKYNYQIDKVIYLKLSDEEAHKRLSKRNRKLFAGSNISHDTRQRIAQRLATYRQQEKEMMNLFRQKNLLLEVNGEGSREEVFARILNGLNIAG